MDFFGIGPAEIFLILVIALIIFGPAKLPEIGRSLGKAINSFRKATLDLSSQVTKEMKEVEAEIAEKQEKPSQSEPKRDETALADKPEAGDKAG